MMQRLLALFTGCLFFQTVIAQKTEFSIGIYGTAAFFRGNAAASASTILLSDTPPTVGDVTINSYGKKPGINGGVDMNILKISKKGFIAGISAGYESLTSKVTITQLESRILTPAAGTTKLTHSFINFFPFVGKRIGGNQVKFDIDLGVDVGFTLSAKEKGEARTSNGTVYTTDFDHQKPSVDLRPRIQFKVQKKTYRCTKQFFVWTS